MHIFFLTIFPDPFKSRILVDKSCRNDTGGDRNHADTKKCNKNTKNLTDRGDRINITIAYSEQGGSSPPDPGKCIRKNLRLRPVFQTVHTETGRQHQYQRSIFELHIVKCVHDTDGQIQENRKHIPVLLAVHTSMCYTQKMPKIITEKVILL